MVLRNYIQKTEKKSEGVKGGGGPDRGRVRGFLSCVSGGRGINRYSKTNLGLQIGHTKHIHTQTQKSTIQRAINNRSQNIDYLPHNMNGYGTDILRRMR
jgi:hypothetical protein